MQLTSSWQKLTSHLTEIFKIGNVRKQSRFEPFAYYALLEYETSEAGEKGTQCTHEDRRKSQEENGAGSGQRRKNSKVVQGFDDVFVVPFLSENVLT